MRAATSIGARLSPAGATIVAVVPEWRNWHTRWIQIHCPLGRAGSTPASGIHRPCAASLEAAMCGRYSLSSPDADLLRRRFNLRESVEVPAQEPRFNIAPTDPVLAVRETGEGRARPRHASLGAGARAMGRAGRPSADQRASRDAGDTARVPRLLPRATMPGPRRRLLRVADRRSRQAPAVVQPPRGRAVRLRRDLGGTAGARGRRSAPQLCDRHLRAERAAASGPRPDAGDPRSGPGGRLAASRRRAGGSAPAAGAGAGRHAGRARGR